MRIHIALEDQHNITLTYPFGTFAYTRMSFGLYNAPVTFQRCILNIFSDLIESCIEVFMDGFSIYGSLFVVCLHNLIKFGKEVLKLTLCLIIKKMSFYG